MSQEINTTLFTEEQDIIQDERDRVALDLRAHGAGRIAVRLTEEDGTVT